MCVGLYVGKDTSVVCVGVCYMYACMHVCMYVRTYVYADVCAGVYMTYTCAYVHAHKLAMFSRKTLLEMLLNMHYFCVC